MKSGKDEVAALSSSLRRWGTWGSDDERGALNFISPAHIVAAARLIRRGQTFSLAIPIAHGEGPQRPNPLGRANPLHLMSATGLDDDPGANLGEGVGLTDDFLVLAVQGGTQWDALCHIYVDDTLYNGYPASDVDAKGAHRNGIDKVHDRFVGRGVLLDVARALGTEHLDPGYAITTEDLAATEERQGVEVGEGDFLLLRTGIMSTVGDFRDWSAFHRAQPGLAYSTAPWLSDRKVAAVAGDTSALEASGQLSDLLVPLHMLMLHDMGIHIGELWYLEELAADCADDGIYEFFLAAQALPIKGGTGSPVNPLAIK
jgi:kynurenine formamidase